MRELAEGVGIVLGFAALIWAAFTHPMAVFWGFLVCGGLITVLLAVYLAGGFSSWVWYKLAERFDWPVVGLDEGRKGEPSRTWVRAIAATRRMRPREWFRAPTEFDEEATRRPQPSRDEELINQWWGRK